MCPNRKCKRQKQITFTPKYIEMAGAGKKYYIKKFKEVKKLRIFFANPQ